MYDAEICGQRTREHARKIVGTRGTGSCTLPSSSPSERHRSFCGRIARTQNYDNRAPAPTVSALLRQFLPKTHACIFLALHHVDRNQKPYTNVRRLIISTSNRYTYAFNSDLTLHMHTGTTQKPDMDQVEIQNLIVPTHPLH